MTKLERLKEINAELRSDLNQIDKENTKDVDSVDWNFRFRFILLFGSSIFLLILGILTSMFYVPVLMMYFIFTIFLVLWDLLDSFSRLDKATQNRFNSHNDKIERLFSEIN